MNPAVWPLLALLVLSVAVTAWPRRPVRTGNIVMADDPATRATVRPGKSVTVAGERCRVLNVQSWDGALIVTVARRG